MDEGAAESQHRSTFATRTGSDGEAISALDAQAPLSESQTTSTAPGTAAVGDRNVAVDGADAGSAVGAGHGTDDPASGRVRLSDEALVRYCLGDALPASHAVGVCSRSFVEWMLM